MRAFLLATLLLAAPLLAGCVQDAATLDRAGGAGPVGLDTSRGWSSPASPALYDVLDAVEVRVASFDGVEMAVAVFLPDVAGCDWQAEVVPDACKVPVVLSASPYWGGAIDRESFRPPVVEWLGTRGYAVAHMSLRGTGESDGCLEFKSPQDVDDVDAVITWLAAQPWSTGDVGMIGRSYVGTGAWSGAASGNPALKTIVPISGAVNGPYLYYKNGTTETRGLINGATYFPGYATDAKPPADWLQRLCKGALVDSHQESGYAALTGDASSAYWQARDLRPAILEGYRGSVWVIHGLQDWNVNPSQVVPFVNEMQDAGIEVKAWLGVWGHAYPDRVDEHRNVRWDWADKTVQWFDKHLKGVDVDTGPAVEVEDSLFVWRGEDAYPPRDATWRAFALGADASLTEGDEAAGPTPWPGTARLVYTSEPLTEPMRVAGLPRLHVTVTPTSAQAGHVFAEAFDVWPDGRQTRLGWAAMNLHYHAGGNTQRAALTPGEPVVAQMEFEPVDALVAEGHRIRLVLHRDGVVDVVESPTKEPLVVTHGDGASTLLFPVVARDTTLPVYAPPRLG